MSWINCRVTKRSRRKRKKTDLIKSEGEGDWGTGIIDDQPREITTDWPGDFRPLVPRVMSNEPDKVEETQTISPEDRPRPGPSSRPTSVRDLPINVRHPDSRQSDPLLTRGERDRRANSRQRNPLITRGEKNRQDSRQRSSFLTQGDKTKSMSQQHSVPGQTPEGQHICREGSPDPTGRRRTGRSDQVATHIDFSNIYKTDINKVYIFARENKIQTETNLHPRLPSQSNG